MDDDFKWKDGFPQHGDYVLVLSNKCHEEETFGKFYDSPVSIAHRQYHGGTSFSWRFLNELGPYGACFDSKFSMTADEITHWMEIPYANERFIEPRKQPEDK